LVAWETAVVASAAEVLAVVLVAEASVVAVVAHAGNQCVVRK
jgi:hypothetical protein